MRRSVQFAAVCITLAAVAGGCGKDDKSSTASGGTLTICSDIPYEPMEMGDGSASTPSGYTGFDIDLVQKIADGANKKLKVSVQPFDGIFGALDAKKCDAVVSSVTITDERKKTMDFTESYLDSDQSLMVRKADVDKYKSLSDLKGKMIGVQQGTTGEEYANKHKPDGAQISSLSGAADLFAALENDKIQAILQDFPINAYRATKNDQVTVQEKFSTDEKYGIAVRKGDADTLKLFNDGLKKAKDDGAYDELFTKYFGKK